MSKKYVISLVTHSAYLDVCTTFLQLYTKNWHNDYLDFVISVIGEPLEIDGFTVINNGYSCTLPGALYNLMESTDYDYCISLLGDAFIYSPIKKEIVELLLNDIEKNNINYCNLLPKLPYRFREYSLDDNLRYITSSDVYNMSFVAFIGSRDFILNEFKNNITDLEFEKKYLKASFFEAIYKDRVILKKNYFNIIPGIDAGKWNRRVLKLLKKTNPEVEFCSRSCVSLKKTILNSIFRISYVFIKKEKREKYKQIIKRLFKESFVTDF